MPFPRELTTPPVMKIYLVVMDHLLTGIVFYNKMAGSQMRCDLVVLSPSLDTIGISLERIAPAAEF
jgi:hypothetical protein